MKQIALIMIVGLCWIGAALRFYQIDTQSLWNDEGSSYVQSTRNFWEIADHAGRDIHPPGYYWGLGLWRIAVGESEFSLRALSAFAGVITIAIAFAIGRDLYGHTAGLTAAGLVTLNSFQLYYSQEARMYALLALWSAAGIWALWHLIRTRGSWRWAIALALINAAGLYTQYVYPTMMITQGVLLVLWIGAEIRQAGAIRLVLPLLGRFIVLNVITIGLYLPWLPSAIAQVTSWPNTGEIAIPLNQALTVIFGWLTLGITYTEVAFPAAASFFLLFGLLVFPQVDGPRSWWRMLFPVVSVITLVGGFLALGLFREANLKFLLPAQIGLALWIGRGVWVLWTLKPRRQALIFRYAPKLAAIMGLISLGSALTGGLHPLYDAPQYARDDYRGIVAAITADADPDDAIILNAPGQSEVFGYYHDGPQPLYLLPIGMTVDAPATEQVIQSLLRDHRRIYAVLWGTDERDPLGMVEGMLDRDAFEIDDRWFGDVRLVRYASPIAIAESVESGARFGPWITLREYAVSVREVRPGEVLQVRLTWSTDAVIQTRYKVFVQLLNPDGTLAAQRDSEPAGGRMPTDTWPIETPIRDQHAILIPNDLPASHYSLIIGLYNPLLPQERVPVGQNDYLILGTITVITRGE